MKTLFGYTSSSDQRRSSCAVSTADAGRLSPTVAGLAQMNNTRTARRILAEARDLLGGNAILLEHHVVRHWADIEAIHTFEGTQTIKTLIVGRDITGIAAFS